MDFDSNSSRSFLTINALLCSSSATLQPSGGSHIPSQTLPGAINAPIPVHLTGNISQNSTTQSGPAPRQHSSNTPQPLIGTDSTTAPTRSNHQFFELCVNSGKFLKALGEIDVSSIKTDGEFFSIVKAHYLRLRGFREKFWLLKPVHVSYVRVGLPFYSHPFPRSELNTRNTVLSRRPLPGRHSPYTRCAPTTNRSRRKTLPLRAMSPRERASYLV